jgi:hypothetical protein
MNIDGVVVYVNRYKPKAVTCAGKPVAVEGYVRPFRRAWLRGRK